MEDFYTAPFNVEQECDRHGGGYSNWLHEDRARMKYTYRDIDARPDKLSDAKFAEWVLGNRQGWLAALSFDWRQGPQRGGDYVARWRLENPEIDDGFAHIEVRQTTLAGSLLIYSKIKWPFFEQRRHDLFVLVKVTPSLRRDGLKLLRQGFCRGWCTKDFFRKNVIISTGKRECEVRNGRVVIDVGTPYVREDMIEFMDTFPIPQDYRLVVIKGKKREPMV